VSKNVFIIGAQKAGTTALHSFLARHPDIEMSRPKELHFFDNEEIDWVNPNYSDFDKHFSSRSALIRGEATPIYLYWPNCLERLHAYDRSAKLIVMLRHPAFRAFSHWKMETLRGAETLSFSEAVHYKGRARVENAPGGVHRVYSYVERGFYARQLYRLLALFPPGQIHFLSTDQLWLYPERTLPAIEKFLGVTNLLATRREYIILASTDVTAEIEPQTRQYLDWVFAPTITETARITGLDLSHWRSSTYAEPIKSK
jgi:hypothetical protein